MDYLIFSRDGILRRSFSGYDYSSRKHHARHVPLITYEKVVDPDVFLKSLHSAISLEEGLTVAELMENLAPWARQMTGVGCLDFPAFLEEVRRTPEVADEELDRIELSYSAKIAPVPKFDRDDILIEKGTFSLGRPVVTGRLYMEDGWSMSAMLKSSFREKYGGSDCVSLSFTPMSEWKHLPLIIKAQGNLRDDTASILSADYLGTSESLTKAGHQNVAVASGANGRVFGHDIAIDAGSPRFFDTLLRGFFWDVGFHYTPIQRDMSLSEVKEAMDGLKLSETSSSEGETPDADPESLYEKHREEEFRYFQDRLRALEDAARDEGLEILLPANKRPRDSNSD